MNNLDPQYQALLQYIINHGTKKQDRTGTGTISVFGRQIRHKMSEGFPLITTKKMAFKTMVTELLYFLRGNTSIEYLVDNKCNIWNGDLSKHHNVDICDYIELAKKDINLFEGGAIYPHQWRNFGSNNYNRKRITIPFKTFFNKEMPNLSSSDCNVGKEFNTLDYGSYIVLDSLKKGVKNETHYKIQFIETNNIKIIRKDKLGTNITDEYKPSKNGVACIGDYKKYNHLDINKLKNIWNGMISRCYNSSNDNYQYYGGKGVYVENRWLCFEYFLSDVNKIKNWDNKLDNWGEYNLDKDIYGDGFIYSLETCCWLSKSDNTKKSKENYKYIITNGIEEHSFTNHVDFICKMGIKNQGNFASMLRGERNICDGWCLVNKEKITDGIDQIEELINTLKTNPDSRRMVVSAWNPSQLHDLTLPACHYGFQVYTRELSTEERKQIFEDRGYVCDVWPFNGNWDGEYDGFGIPRRAISLMWSQRSCDTFLGLPFNIASYGLLLEIIAKAVNMVPDELIGNLGDTHLYSNHIEQAEEQMSREPYALPKLNINTEWWPTEGGECGIGPIDAIAVFNSFKDDNFCKSLLEEDIQLGEYKSHPSIKAPLSN